VNKKIIFLDMDDVLADYAKAAVDYNSKKVLEYKMWDKDFFLNLKPIPGAQGAAFELAKMGFDLHVLSQPLADGPESYSDKAKWIQLYFPHLYKKITLTQDKGLVRGDYLIDDNYKKWQNPFEANGGKFIHFEYGGYNHLSLETQPDPEMLWRQIVTWFSHQNPHK
jgi:5'(3')-deoxyribonucleotidase